MHKEQSEFIAKNVPKYYKGGTVVDVGSKDINGNNRQFFPSDVKYTGVDLSAGPNVDVVGHFADLHGFTNVDFIISTEALEHDKRWHSTLVTMILSLKVGGILMVTAAGLGRPEHGTRRTTPHDSPDTNDYYGNITAKHLYTVLKSCYDADVFAVVKEFYEGNGDIYFVLERVKKLKNPDYSFFINSVNKHFGTVFASKDLIDNNTIIDVDNTNLAIGLAALVNGVTTIFLPYNVETSLLTDYNNAFKMCIVYDRRYTKDFLRDYEAINIITSFYQDYEIWKAFSH